VTSISLRVHPLVALFLVACTGSNCGNEATQSSRGIAFPTSCSSTTQARFGKGVFLLHNMMYKQAYAEFESAAQVDPECAMLHWGIAMSQFQPKWPGDPTEDALRTGAAAVERARSMVARSTDRENGYIEAVGAYYENWQNRDRNARKASWHEAQGRHAAAHPGDSEAQIFLALAQLTTSDPYDRAYAQDLRAGEALEKILEQRPEHSGLMHYLLHAYDNPVHAERGVAAAQGYEAVAPDAPHALHMPSHIYVRLGNWEQVIFWNIRSRDSATRQPLPDGKMSRHLLHALDYLVYGYLQVADDESARREAAKVNAQTGWEPNSGPGAYALAAVPARLAIERRAWKEAAALPARSIPYVWDRYPWAEAITYAARGLGAAHNGNIEAAQRSIVELDRLKGLIKESWWQGRIQLERDVISGWVAHRQGMADEAVKRISHAAEQELAAGKLSVEPGHTIYAIEQLGELLLELKRPKEALEVFQRSLEDSPRRFHSLAGAGKAAEMADMQKEAVDYYTALTKIAVDGNKRPQTKHATGFLAKMTP